MFGLPTFARLSWGTATELMEKECYSVKWEDHDEEDELEQQKASQKSAKKRSHGGEVLQSNRPSRKCPFFRENNIHRVSLAASLDSDVLTC